MTDEHDEFLLYLRDSGETNMWGAAPYLQEEFGLSYEITTEHTGVTATGNKVHYYSSNRKASSLFGYAPKVTSLEVVLDQAQRKLFGRNV